MAEWGKKMARAKRSIARRSRGLSGPRRRLTPWLAPLVQGGVMMDGVKRLGKSSIRPKHAITGDSPKMHAITWKPRDLKPKPTQIPTTKKQTGKKKKRTQVPVVKVEPKQSRDRSRSRSQSTVGSHVRTWSRVFFNWCRDEHIQQSHGCIWLSV